MGTNSASSLVLNVSQVDRQHRERRAEGRRWRVANGGTADHKLEPVTGNTAPGGSAAGSSTTAR